MSKVHLVIPDPHAHPDHDNIRADWLSQLTMDIKPDVVVNLGDTWDMSSLSSYDKGTRSFQGRLYQKDIEVGIEFNDRWWAPIKKRKKKLPKRIFLEGNHEFRIKRAIELSPELEGDKFGISFNNLQLKDYYDEVVEYEGGYPGQTKIDGINYAHFFISGVMGRPIGGQHPAYSLLTKNFESCTAGHTHVFNHCTRTTASGKLLQGLVAGVFQDYHSTWAGRANQLWQRGVVIKRNVDDGNYDLEWVSVEQLRQEYGG